MRGSVASGIAAANGARGRGMMFLACGTERLREWCIRSLGLWCVCCRELDETVLGGAGGSGDNELGRCLPCGAGPRLSAM
jgi:hypothetical protein